MPRRVQDRMEPMFRRDLRSPRAAALLFAALLLPRLQAQSPAPVGPPPGGQAGPAPVFVWDYYEYVVKDWHPQFRVTITGIQGNGADLFLKLGSKPTEDDYDLAVATPGTSDESVLLNAGSDPPLQSGRWWIGVRRPPADQVQYQASYELVPSVHAGMGSVPYQDPSGITGTAFRVWAPFAARVWVSGDFNGWQEQESALVSEGNGNWSLDVRNVGHGTQYKYVIDTGLWIQWRNDPRVLELTASNGNGFVFDHDSYDWAGHSFSTPAWNEMVIYQMHVGTFVDDPGGLPGTFETAMTRFDYLQDLGVNVIQLMPTGEFPGDYSWGYNTSHPFSTESHYGGVNGLKEFVRQAQSRGIAVFGDVVYNHWGPNDLDLWQFDGWSENGYGGIYFYNDWRASTMWGDTRPDYGRGEVRQYIRDANLMWLEDFRLDGLRWDSTVNVRTVDNGFGGDIPDGWSLMQWVNDEVDWFQGWKIMIAEDMWNNEWITKDTWEGGAGFDSQWDPNVIHPIRTVMTTVNDPDRNMWDVKTAIEHRYNGDAFERVIYTESHDEVANGRSRVPEEIWPGNAGSWFSRKRSTLGAALVMTSPGIPMIFQGQEILEDGYFADDDPVDWSKLQTYSGIHALYRDLIRLRRNWFNNTRGLRGQNVNVYHVNDNDKFVAFHRWDQGGPGDDVVVLMNWADRSYTNYNVGFPQGGTWELVFNSDWNGYSADYGNHPAGDLNPWWGPRDGLDYQADVSIGPYTCLIYSRR